ncbi:unnamed protein product [Rhizophagus irregularis]|nr:unnamed protein product [Rhizophagus irregularis]
MEISEWIYNNIKIKWRVEKYGWSCEIRAGLWASANSLATERCNGYHLTILNNFFLIIIYETPNNTLRLNADKVNFKNGKLDAVICPRDSTSIRLSMVSLQTNLFEKD